MWGIEAWLGDCLLNKLLRYTGATHSTCSLIWNLVSFSLANPLNKCIMTRWLFACPLYSTSSSIPYLFLTSSPHVTALQTSILDLLDSRYRSRVTNPRTSANNFCELILLSDFLGSIPRWGETHYSRLPLRCPVYSAIQSWQGFRPLFITFSSYIAAQCEMWHFKTRAIDRS